MNDTYRDIAIIQNKHNGHFEFRVEGKIAFIEYQLSDDVIALLHTEVPPELEGRGIASALAGKVFEYLKSKNLQIKIYCPYLLNWVKKHPEWQDL